jgi:hypothetical protein
MLIYTSMLARCSERLTKSPCPVYQAEKELQKKQKAQAFSQGKAKGKVTKNAKRWN